MVAEPAEPASLVIKGPATSPVSEGRSVAEPISGPEAAADAASVVVRAVHSVTGVAMPNLPLLLWSGSENGDPWAANQRGCTDERGQAHFHVRPGPCEVTGA